MLHTYIHTVSEMSALELVAINSPDSNENT